MGASDNLPPHERPTQPDIDRPDSKVECPNCKDKDGRPRGHVFINVGAGLEPQTCDVCWGSKLVTRETVARFALRFGALGAHGKDRVPSSR